MTYKGDTHLGTLLTNANSAYSVDEAKDIISAVLSTPADPSNPDAWTSLIAEDVNSDLLEQLNALKDDLQKSRKTDTRSVPERIESLRQEFTKHSINGFIIPRADEYQGEYVPESAERLSWSTGFTGSAGQALVLDDSAIFLTDGRYTLQAKDEVPEDIFDHRNSHGVTDSKTDLEIWLEEKASGKTIGFDPWMHSTAQVEKLEEAVSKAGGKLVPVLENMVDNAWDNQPPSPLSPVITHEMEFAGKNSAEKRQDIADDLKNQGANAVALTMPEDIAWLLNIRGGDVPCTPLPLSFAIAHEDGTVDLFIDQRKLTTEIIDHLGDDVRIHDRDNFAQDLATLGVQEKTVLIDENLTPAKVQMVLEENGATVLKGKSPCQLPKAIKNDVEQQGTINCHIVDGIALTQFLHELSQPDVVSQNSELSASNMLEDFRKVGPNYRGLSFDTISGAGSNGAVIHYRVTEDTDKPLNAGPVYLVDSGGQYSNGTTDVTRTVAVGPVTDEMKDRFSRVLKGHIQVAKAVFRHGEAGAELDDKARDALREIGENFAHGTGHGVGSYLSVHEGPQGISPRSTTPLEEGMIVSNEPGYYKDGEYGIRIESLVLVESAGNDDDGHPLLKFKTLTMAPIDRNLINADLLDDDEREWLNDYHAEVRDTLLPELEKANPDAAKWLKEITAPLASNSQADNGHRPPSHAGGKNAL